MYYFKSAILNTFQFSGRASRKQYWMYILMNWAVLFFFGLVAGIVHEYSVEVSEAILIIGVVYFLTSCITSFSIGWRRMHDLNRAGLWVFVPIISTIFLFLKGDPNANDYGDPFNPDSISH